MKTEILTQDNAEKFADILRKAVTSYIENKDTVSTSEWLRGYLTAEMPNKSADEIALITEQIISTIAAHEKQVISLKEALTSGKSVEKWFADELDNEKSAGEQAKELVECHVELTKAANEYSEEDEQQEIIEVEEIPPEEWNDENWNKYKMKDLVSETVRQAGETALKATATDLYQKVTEYGFKTVLCDKELITESIMNGAGQGIKAATAGALEIASERNILPRTGNSKTKAVLAGLAIENVKVLGKVAKGDIGLSEGLAMIKNNTIATVSTIIKEKIGMKAGAAIGTIFGPAGTAIGAFVGGAVAKLAGTNVGSKIVSTAKTVCSAAKTVVSKAVSTVKSGVSKVVSGVKSFFSRW